ncbi:hypothetical protein SAMN06295879_0436 [Agreia bicolorata]|uniref:Uncharacterized protein n=1 Tax=Agreia bicolorata TaxID=110935 RepID=A0A1T4WXV1_9MICO|nr:hypothetical protein [Agreia bicolorata]SKA82134.1 hypothetical protein SAMN06295879_0436 [Agreia bicolorata]
MTAPVPARDHANMTVAEREFTFDSLLAEFGDPDASAQVDADSAPGPAIAAAAPVPTVAAAAPVPAAAPVAHTAPPQRRQVADAAAASPAPTRRSAAKAAAQAPIAQSPAPFAAPRRRAARLSLPMPSAGVLKLGGLVAVAGISLTLAYVALSR